MIKIIDLVKQDAPTTLVQAWESFQRHVAAHPETRDPVVPYVKSAQTLPEAIRRAVASKDAAGKHYHHQSKIHRDTYPAFYGKLMGVQALIRHSRDFDQLYSTIARVECFGVGELYAYDVSVRLGAFLGLSPAAVYLHAGVRAGAKELGLNVAGKVKLEWSDLPDALRQSGDFDMMEDFLCCCKSIFKELKR